MAWTLPWWFSGKESVCQCRRQGFDLWVGKIPWTRKWQAPPVFLPGESHGQSDLAGYSPWGWKRVRHESVTKQQLYMYISCISGDKSFLSGQPFCQCTGNKIIKLGVSKLAMSADWLYWPTQGLMYFKLTFRFWRFYIKFVDFWLLLIRKSPISLSPKFCYSIWPHQPRQMVFLP